MHWRALLMLLLALTAASVFSGCGPASATVSGEVSVDGKLLEKGFISYVSADGVGAPLTVPIQNGRYELRTVAGNKRVQISAPVVVGKRKEHNGPGAPLVEITAERLPERYNSKTELTFEVLAGSNTKNWSVQSKGKS